jgi:hypothetical protein
MSAIRKEYATVGFQWELLALIVDSWSRQNFGVDVRRELGDERLRKVLDDDYCRGVAKAFRNHWITPKVIDIDRQERVAGVLAALDELVEETFNESEGLHELFKSKCRAAGCDLDEAVAMEAAPPARRAAG